VRARRKLSTTFSASTRGAYSSTAARTAPLSTVFKGGSCAVSTGRPDASGSTRRLTHPARIDHVPPAAALTAQRLRDNDRDAVAAGDDTTLGRPRACTHACHQARAPLRVRRIRETARVKPPRFAYSRPGSVDEALSLLAEVGAVPLAGGQSLLMLLNLRRRRPRHLVDLEALPGLDRIAEEDGRLVLGALVRHDRLEGSDAVRRSAPLLAEAISLVANPQVRARGTVGGSVAHADPAGELVTALVALNATAVLRGPAGEREVPVAGLASGPFETRIERDELLVRVRVPQSASAAAAFQEVAPRFAARAIACAAALASRDREGRLRGIRAAVGGVAGAPAALEGVDQLDGLDLDDPELDRIVRTAVTRLPAAMDARASANYRRDAAAALAARAIRRAAGSAEPHRGDGAHQRDDPGPGDHQHRADGPRVPPAARGRVPAAATAQIRLRVNGREVVQSVPPRLLLSDFLRHRLGLTAAHAGCEHGVCGACNVLVDGRAVRSCLMVAVQAEGREVTTLEGLAADDSTAALREAFVSGHALQCGFCTPGFLVTFRELRARGEEPAPERLAGNLCRCTGYLPILAAGRAP
jgi:CO/xanthine dehydrogenase FAD-binding subunit/aerobic-type carbon monoxide dehydrogenase small subunit (CoxS/CutS family)